MITRFWVENMKPNAQKRGCILKKGAKIRKGFKSCIAGSKALVNKLSTFVFHKKGNEICHCPYHEGSRGTAPLILNFSTKWRLVFNFTLQSLYPRSKNPHYPLNGKVVGP
jgi:hypothetical protein